MKTCYLTVSLRIYSLFISETVLLSQHRNLQFMYELRKYDTRSNNLTVSTHTHTHTHTHIYIYIYIYMN
jgi:hypothetical protein